MINLNLGATTGVYIGAKNVYIAQLKGTFFGARLVKFGKTEIQLPPQADESTTRQAAVQALRKALRENNITSKKVFAALPGKDVLIRYFQMPVIPRLEWETAIKFEAKKYIPFKIEELMWDFHVVLPKGKKDGKMGVTFVAVKREVAQKYLSLFEQADLKPSVLEPAPFTLVRVLALGKQLAKDKPTAVVDVDYGMADINIVKDGICYLTRDVSLPLEGEMLFESLLNEIRMSLDYYEKLFPAEVIGKILLCGEIGPKDWDRKLAEELKVPAEKADPARAIKISNSPPPLNVAVAIGLGLRGMARAGAEVNLLQVREVKSKVVVTKEALALTPEILQAVIRAVLLSCMGFLILYLVMHIRISQEKAKLEQVIDLRPKIGLPIGSFSYSRLEEINKELENKVSTLNLIIDQRFFRTNSFNELPKVIPPGVWLTELSLIDRLSKENKITHSLNIKGVAYHEDPVREIGIVTKFVSNLKENKIFSRGFEDIKLDTMSSAELKGMPVKNFTISCVGR